MDGEPANSARKSELLEAAYDYVLVHGLTVISLRPLAEAIGSSPRVLLYLFGSKDGLIRALLARSRTEELRLLAELRNQASDGLHEAARRLWLWLADAQRRGLLTLWLEGYARSMVEPTGPWAGFGRSTVEDWLALLAHHQKSPTTAAAEAERTYVLAVLRGALLDLLATGDTDRITVAVHRALEGTIATDRRTPDVRH
jgi:AcrR family transcriptional regulator